MILSQSTSQAVTAALARAADYLIGRQSPTGGFCFYRGEFVDEPNLADSWGAIASLCLLGRAIPDIDRLGRFIASSNVDAQPHALYHRVRSMLVLQQSDHHADRVRDCAVTAVSQTFAQLESTGLDFSLHRLWYVLWLNRHFRIAAVPCSLASELQKREAAGGGFPSSPDLLTTRASVAVLAFVGHNGSHSTKDFIRALATPRLGFRSTLHSLAPNLETTAAGLDACRYVGILAPDPDGLARFVLACQSTRGAFARAPGALPDIHWTRLAVRGLVALQADRSGPTRPIAAQTTHCAGTGAAP